MSVTDYYEIIGVARNASRTTVTRALRRRYWELSEDTSPRAKSLLAELGEAEVVFKTPKDRKRYDKDLDVQILAEKEGLKNPQIFEAEFSNIVENGGRRQPDARDAVVWGNPFFVPFVGMLATANSMREKFLEYNQIPANLIDLSAAGAIQMINYWRLMGRTVLMLRDNGASRGQITKDNTIAPSP